MRHGTDLGWSIVLIDDACFTVERKLRDGRTVSAADMHARSLALLDGEYAGIVATADLLEWVAGRASDAT